MIHNTVLLLVKIGVLAWSLVYTIIKVLSDFLILVQPFFPNITEVINRKNISLLCYWDGKISRGSQGITYENAIPKAIKVNCEIKYSELIEKIYDLIEIGSEQYKLKIICRYLANGQYIGLAIDNDESVDIMLEMTKEKGINCVELYIEKSFVSVQSQSNVQFTVNNGGNEGARDSSYIHFNVRGLDGNETPCRMKSDTPVWNLKTAFSKRKQWNYDDIRFIYGGRQLEDQKTLNEYDIRDDSVIHAILSLRGD